ncbi:hypothetical protein L1987_09812 [Smallanthus sonchifolius]|uniref:Uncharacterized protein n=1 Tax=Smallanthus sonchifolius TaxID=185202 RepID=A0ACB9JQD0_9ASTR|nr:hypothetical protein L1987_09812 [Smallanthus sonchifolius]
MLLTSTTEKKTKPRILSIKIWTFLLCFLSFSLSFLPLISSIFYGLASATGSFNLQVSSFIIIIIFIVTTPILLIKRVNACNLSFLIVSIINGKKIIQMSSYS